MCIVEIANTPKAMHVATSRTRERLQHSITINIILTAIVQGFLLFTILNPCFIKLTARFIGKKCCLVASTNSKV